MPEFNYIALDAATMEVKGVIDAASREEAVAKLRRQGYAPTSVVPADAASAPSAPQVRQVTDSYTGTRWPFELIFVFGGGFILLAGLIWLIRTSAFVFRAVKAPGIVSKVEAQDDSDGHTAYFSVFTFTDAAGASHTQKSSIGSPHPAFPEGTAVTVLYDASSPTNAKIDSFQNVWLGPLAITGFGSVFTAFACVFAAAFRAGRRKSVTGALVT